MGQTLRKWICACFLGTCAWLCVLGGGLCVALASTRMLCVLCVLACFACLRAVPTPMPRAPTADTSLGHETIHGTNMLIGRTCDAAEHASLPKLPPRIHRLTLRWDAMDMSILPGQSGKHAYQMTKHRVHFFLACPGRRGACRRSLGAAAACMLAVIPITIPLSCCFICSWLSCPVHAKTEWKGLVQKGRNWFHRSVLLHARLTHSVVVVSSRLRWIAM